VLEIVKREANKIGVSGIDPSRRKITQDVEHFERFFDVYVGKYSYVWLVLVVTFVLVYRQKGGRKVM